MASPCAGEEGGLALWLSRLSCGSLVPYVLVRTELGRLPRQWRDMDPRGGAGYVEGFQFLSVRLSV